MPLYKELLHRLIVRYLNGAGHPTTMRGGFISTDEFDRDRASAALRASLLLRAATDSDLPPGKPDWRINVSGYPRNVAPSYSFFGRSRSTSTLEI